MKLVVGLGNPGKEYLNTRHNIGFMVIDKFLDINGEVLSKTKFNGRYVKLSIKGEEVIFLEPQSYMNLSGTVIARFIDYFKISINDLLIICDDVNMNLGIIKLKFFGSSGGHNGLKNIEKILNTKEYRRLKIGISKPNDRDVKDYVLEKFTEEEEIKIKELLNITNNILSDFLNIKFDELMNKYNLKNR